MGAALFGYGATTIKFAFSSDPLGPQAFPLLLSAALVLCGLWYWLQPGESDPVPGRKELANVAGFLALACITTALMPWSGFILAMVALCTGMALMFGAKPWLALLGGVAQAIVWWALFGPLLGGNLPVGPLGF